MRALAWLALLASTAQAQKLPVDDEPTPPPPSAQTQLDRAHALYAEERYQQALALEQALYAERQSPELLFEIGLCFQRLGRAKEAIESYQRYLVAQPGGQFEPDARAALRALGGFLTAAPSPLPQVTVKMIRRPNRAMLATGWSLLSTSYFAAFMSGAIIAGTCGNCGNAGDNFAAGAGTLIVPLVGPFISSLIIQNPVWSLPWSLVDGFMQITGLALVIASYTHPETVPRFKYNAASLRLSTTGHGLALSGTF